MMPLSSTQIREKFLQFFESKGHKIVSSAPIVLKNDPTLMFTNAGMNQFKDYFLGNKIASNKRVVDTQKCLRVSGKHNDLEEVGIDTYHHTMFEMLGNWSFGDYFKQEAIEWAWKLLVDEYQLPVERLYVTVFDGDVSDNLEADEESKAIWASFIDPERILHGNKKDNFWEMGETGPCGPCSEIHIDLRPQSEIDLIPGRDVVNGSHPQVIEIWNNVFMQFNRKADGSLEKLPAQHVDTGMGFERLVRVIQGKSSNYDSDIFMPMIQKMEKDLSFSYLGGDSNLNSDIAARVIADHIRAITFTIADGQLPSSNGAGYVIRRILRRAVRYGAKYLNITQPYIFQLVDILSEKFKEVFPEVVAQKEFIKKIIQEEETSFLRTLSSGSKKFEAYLSGFSGLKIPGKFVFELYDTFGFPFDLTALMAKEAFREVDELEFNALLLEQKNRSKNAASKVEGDWVIIKESNDKIEFTGYDTLQEEIHLLRYRKIEQKGKTLFQLVFDKTCFYPEGGGQVGDTGYISSANDKLRIIDTKKENDLILHISEELPEVLDSVFYGVVDEVKRLETENNHSVTHLLHAALRQVLGTHVSQKGSLVNDKMTRFDFAHFSKMSSEEIEKVEDILNQKIRADIHLLENRTVPVKEAMESGAMALFGEKYGETVRTITFDPLYSIELCGGTHVKSTGNIGMFKIISESAIAAGVRRIEGITGKTAFEYVRNEGKILQETKELLKNPRNLVSAVESLKDENKRLKDELDAMKLKSANGIADIYIAKATVFGNLPFLKEIINEYDSDFVRLIVQEMRIKSPNLLTVIGNAYQGKASIWLSIPDNLVKEKGLNAVEIIKLISPMIEGGGGGQPTFANAGGKNILGLSIALDKAQEIIQEKLV